MDVLYALGHALEAAGGLAWQIAWQLVLGVLLPATRTATALHASITWDDATILNIAFFVVAGVLVRRSFATGGRQMLRMMGGPPSGSGAPPSAAGHSHHHGDPSRMVD